MKGTNLKGQVLRILELVQLSGFESDAPAVRRPAAAGRACAGTREQSEVLLLDEPLGALDLKLRKEMQLFIKGLQNDVGITFIHVTHDQEEAMTMADTIAVMHGGKIEQLGPRTSSMSGRGRRLSRDSSASRTSCRDGQRARSRPACRRDGRPRARSNGAGPVSIGIRPEKIRLGGGAENTLEGTVKEQAYIGVSTQYVVETAAGTITVYVQNTDPGAQLARPGDRVTLSWSPEATFVVSVVGEKEEKTE